MKIEINNRQKARRPNRQRIRRLIQYLTERIAPADWREISLLLTDDAGIRNLNERLLGRPETTDVISLRYDPIPGDDSLCSVEIMVNVQRAVEVAGKRNASRELALYIAHGYNHLLNESDALSRGRRRMRRRELRWLKQADEKGLVKNLIANWK
jgi:rRNA maturation RNase YbeY